MPYLVWGSELSPFTLKLHAQLRYANIPFVDLPRAGRRLQNYRINFLIEQSKRQRKALRFPKLDALDEYPLVPFLIDADETVLYDSSALAHWIDARHPPAGGPLFPDEPAAAFVAQLTMASSEDGQTAAMGTPGFDIGPYLRQMPTNPLNEKGSIQIVQGAGALPGVGDNSHGWIYQPATLEIIADSPGTDSTGELYYDY